MNRMDIDALRQLLAYDPETGKLTWLARPDGSVQWNARFAGNEAFTSSHSYGYRSGRIFNRGYLAHRVIWAMTYGEWPEYIDHINGITDDNRISNLRNVSMQENGRNAAMPIHNTSGVVGVSWYKRDEKWKVQIRADGRDRYLGYFTNFDDAVAARKAAESRYGYHINHGRAS